MALLHNRVSRSALKARVEDDPTPRITLSFYKYILLADPQAFRDQLYAAWTPLQVFGRIYVASEGINAQLSIPQQNFEAFKDQLYALPGFEGLRLNSAVEENRKSFFVLDIKVRKKIVADGIDDPLFDVHRNGQYVDAATFNQLADQPGTYVIDMRNHYEYEVGHFRTAIEIPSDTFREQLPMAAEMMAGQEDKTIIMYCTGGIRCEKASAYLRHRGFQKVFHLEGGIIHYSQQVKALQLPNQFIGKNFVFDDRLGERISSDIIAQCHQCGQPCDTHVNCANAACHLLFIQCEQCKQSMLGTCSQECFDFTQLPEEEQKRLRKGIDKGRNIFNKSRKHRLRPRSRD